MPAECFLPDHLRERNARGRERENRRFLLEAAADATIRRNEFDLADTVAKATGQQVHEVAVVDSVEEARHLADERSLDPDASYRAEFAIGRKEPKRAPKPGAGATPLPGTPEWESLATATDAREAARAARDEGLGEVLIADWERGNARYADESAGR